MDFDIFFTQEWFDYSYTDTWANVPTFDNIGVDSGYVDPGFGYVDPGFGYADYSLVPPTYGIGIIQDSFNNFYANQQIIGSFNPNFR